MSIYYKNKRITGTGAGATNLTPLTRSGEKIASFRTFDGTTDYLYASGSGSGGGVIDGTLLKEKTTITTLTFTTTEQDTYKVDNDCLLVVYSPTSFNTDFIFTIDGNIVGSFTHVPDGSEEHDSFSIPVKKNTTLKCKTSNGSQNIELWFYEYKLNSLAPQIAMPDYNNGIELTATGNEWNEVIENGYIAFNNNGNSSDITWKTYLSSNIGEIETSYEKGVDGGDNNMVPVSKGDKWKSNTNVPNVGPYKQLRVFFFPCKQVPQSDCASYVISSWHDDTEWCRIYSDGWCEQGGVCDNGNYGQTWSKKVNLYKNFIQNNYNVQLTPKDANSTQDYQINCGFNSNRYDLSSFMISYNGLFGGNDDARYMNWEAKGWIK